MSDQLPPPYVPPAGPPQQAGQVVPPPYEPPSAAVAPAPPTPAAAAPAPAAPAAAPHGHAAAPSSRRGLAIAAGLIGLAVLAVWLVADVIAGRSSGAYRVEGMYGAYRWIDDYRTFAGEPGVENSWVFVLFAAIIIFTYVELLMGSLACLTGWRRGWSTLLLAAVLPVITWFVVWPVVAVSVYDGVTFADAVDRPLEDPVFMLLQLPTCALLVVAALMARAARPGRRRSR
jgi:hypothetical protein